MPSSTKVYLPSWVHPDVNQHWDGLPVVLMLIHRIGYHYKTPGGHNDNEHLQRLHYLLVPSLLQRLLHHAHYNWNKLSELCVCSLFNIPDHDVSASPPMHLPTGLHLDVNQHRHGLSMVLVLVHWHIYGDKTSSGRRDDDLLQGLCHILLPWLFQWLLHHAHHDRNQLSYLHVRSLYIYYFSLASNYHNYNQELVKHFFITPFVELPQLHQRKTRNAQILLAKPVRI
ncbi:hypothetical protein BKA70DRAFT_1422119 [Coprinopsis sp. MPI-PUGE-AT-0042]|nr:hypothetical protein BKA70DRAFT_1422119 [Coprinopsis sp. MPI-PUGE-AT-0042]